MVGLGLLKGVTYRKSLGNTALESVQLQNLKCGVNAFRLGRLF